VISVSDTLDRIHTDWNFIETHLFRQIAEIEAHAEEEDDPNADRNLDTFLYKRFEQIADMQRGGRQILFSARTSLFSDLFPLLLPYSPTTQIPLKVATRWPKSGRSLRISFTWRMKSSSTVRASSPRSIHGLSR